MKVLEKFKLLDPAASTLPILVFDIETVRSFDILPEEGPVFDAWAYQRRNSDDLTYEGLASSYSTDAPLYSAFCQVVSISFGYYKGGEVLIKSFSSLDEKELLTKVANFLNFKAVRDNFSLGGFAIKGYDIPILCKRYLANGISIPDILDNSTKKPWELDVYDLMEMLKMNGFYNESLITACLLLGVESPKSNMDGSGVSDLFYSAPEVPAPKKKTKAKAKEEVEETEEVPTLTAEEIKQQNLLQIQSYCNKDVHATINCFLKLLQWDLVKEYKEK